MDDTFWYWVVVCVLIGKMGIWMWGFFRQQAHNLRLDREVRARVYDIYSRDNIIDDFLRYGNENEVTPEYERIAEKAHAIIRSYRDPETELEVEDGKPE